MRLAALALLLPLMTPAANYSAHKVVVDGIEVVRLADAASRTEVSIAPSIGNMAYEIKVDGKNILWFPFASPAGLKAKPQFCGIPFLAPWANRIDGDSYWINGKQHTLDPALHNFNRDSHGKPIHGLLNYSPGWELVSVIAGDRDASATSRLDFARHPALMAQFPFAHTVTMTYRLSAGAVEVETVIDNHSSEAFPIAIGFHPYFRLPDAPRDQWLVHLAAKDHLVLSKDLIPTGERKPLEFADPLPLGGAQLDDVFSGLSRDRDGRARFWVQGAKQRVTVLYGPKYTVAVVYAPPGREFICFEPMAAVTDAFNLSHSGVYRDLASISPASQWKESFWIQPSGF